MCNRRIVGLGHELSMIICQAEDLTELSYLVDVFDSTLPVKRRMIEDMGLIR